MFRKRSFPVLAFFVPLLLCGATLTANAQPGGPMFDDGPLFDDGPRGNRPPGEGGPGGPGGPRGRGPRGGKGRLEGTLRGIKRLQSEDKSLSKAQAAKLVSLIKPWTTRAQMSDAESQKLVMSMEAVLTTAQKSKVGPPGRGGQGRGGPGQGGPGGGPRHGDDGNFGPPPPPDGEDGPPRPPDGDFGPPGSERGGRGEGDRRGPGGPGMRPPANFNPFYAPTGRSDWKKLPSATQQLLARRYRENRAVLESLSRFAKS